MWATFSPIFNAILPQGALALELHCSSVPQPRTLFAHCVTLTHQVAVIAHSVDSS